MNKLGTYTGETVAKSQGNEIPIRYTGAPLRDDTGETIGAVEYVLNITDEINAIDTIKDLVEASTEGRLDEREPNSIVIREISRKSS
jgi:methyl-accepting chemotaxis protein